MAQRLVKVLRVCVIWSACNEFLGEASNFHASGRSPARTDRQW